MEMVYARGVQKQWTLARCVRQFARGYLLFSGITRPVRSSHFIRGFRTQ